MSHCRICGGPLQEFCDFGPQPLSSAFRIPSDTHDEYFYRLAIAACQACTMVQLVNEVPRHLMFNHHYPYLSSGSAAMRKHFEQTANHFLETELTTPDSLIIELGCNDGVMLKPLADNGTRHLGVEPSESVAAIARQNGINITTEFFQESTAVQIRETHGPAKVIYAANTICHIPYLDSIFRGIDQLLTPDGIFAFEDPYLGDIISQTAFDQIYDEHFYYFTATSVAAMAKHHGFELVNVERLPVHGGEIRYTLARPGARQATAAVSELLAEEHHRQLTNSDTLRQFVTRVRKARHDLTTLLHKLHNHGHAIAAYGATAKSATVTNYCGIGPSLVSYIADTTPTKQGKVNPGTHIPIHSTAAFANPYPDYALLFAWNHAEEIIAKEHQFRSTGGKWILYIPEVHIV